MKFLRIIFLLPKLCFAIELSSLCQKEASDFGNGISKNLISYRCVEYFKKNTPINGHKQLMDKSLEVFGQKNIIIFERNTKPKTLINAGGATLLENISSVAVDEVNKEVAILEESGKVYIYPLNFTGNIAPFRIIDSPEIIGANDLTIDTDDGLIFINNPKINQIIAFDRKANQMMPEGLRKTDIKIRIEKIPEGVSSIFYEKSKHEIFALDSLKNKIYVFKINNLKQESTLTNIISIESIKKPLKISIDSIKNEIIITNADKKEFRIPNSNLIQSSN